MSELVSVSLTTSTLTDRSVEVVYESYSELVSYATSTPSNITSDEMTVAVIVTVTSDITSGTFVTANLAASPTLTAVANPGASTLLTASISRPSEASTADGGESPTATLREPFNTAMTPTPDIEAAYLETQAPFAEHAMCHLTGPDRLPSEKRFVTIPNIRGTLQILWTCVSTLVICVYSVLHINVAPYAEGTKPRFQLWRTMMWSLIILAVPEFCLTDSICEFHDARKMRKRFDADTSISKRARDSWTLTHFFYANMGGLVYHHGNELIPLRGQHIQGAINSGSIDPIASITLWEIEDKSKEGPFLQSIAVLQILYFYVQVLARWGEGLDVSLLELAVAAIGIYSLANYAFLWKKPKSVDVPTVMRLLKEPREMNDGTATLLDFSTSEGTELDDIRSSAASAHSSTGKTTVTSWYTKAQANPKIATLGRFLHHEDMGSWLALGVFCLSIPQGAIHIAGWKFAYPTSTDKWLWRISSIISTTAGPALGLLFLCLGILLAVGDEVENKFVKYCGYLPVFLLGVVGLALAILYFPARLILLAEMIRCLFYLPPDAYKAVTWAMSIPHFT